MFFDIRVLLKHIPGSACKEIDVALDNGLMPSACDCVTEIYLINSVNVKHLDYFQHQMLKIISYHNPRT